MGYSTKKMFQKRTEIVARTFGSYISRLSLYCVEITMINTKDGLDHHFHPPYQSQRRFWFISHAVVRSLFRVTIYRSTTIKSVKKKKLNITTLSWTSIHPLLSIRNPEMQRKSTSQINLHHKIKHWILSHPGWVDFITITGSFLSSLKLL